MPEAQPGERHPNALGDSSVSTPTGVLSTDSAQQRVAQLSTMADINLSALEGLHDQLQEIQAMEYQPGMIRPRAGSVFGKLLHLRRAQDPYFEKKQRMKFEVGKSRVMGQLVQQLSVMSAQLRQARPGLDEAMKAREEVRNEAAQQQIKLKQAGDLVEAIAAVSAKNGRPMDDTAKLEMKLMIAKIPSEREVYTKELQLMALLKDNAMGFDEAALAGLPKDRADAVRRFQKDIRATRKKDDVDLSTLLNPQTLTNRYYKKVKDLQSIYGRREMIQDVTTPSLYGLGATEPGWKKIPMTTNVMRELEQRAAWQMYNELRNTPGISDKAAERAMNNTLVATDFTWDDVKGIVWDADIAKNRLDGYLKDAASGVDE